MLKESVGRFNAEGGVDRLNGLQDTTISKAIWVPVGTYYNAADQVGFLGFYSGDSKQLEWDENSGRLLWWNSSVGTKYREGVLNWNANGTLQQISITDTANTANTQTCNYVYDDLERLSSANCGAPWSQTFNYDAFGNIWQYGSSIFNPGYGSGNHVTGFGYGGGGNYNNGAGNVTNDGSNTYTYNAEGRPATMNSATAVYDAFTRLVEVQGSSGDHTQLVYAPDGFKFAYMNGQTVEKYIAPLAAGVQAVFARGSSRLSTQVDCRISEKKTRTFLRPIGLSARICAAIRIAPNARIIGPGAVQESGASVDLTVDMRG